MCRTVSFKVSSGMDSTARVLTTLRRKKFDVKEFNMKEIDNQKTRLIVTLEDNNKLGFERALLQIKKLIDVYDIREI